MFFTNKELADALENIADELEILDENPYRIRAYRRAASSLKEGAGGINHNLKLIKRFT